MAYKSITIQKAIQLINRKFYLPSLQRPYVWDTKQIELLFDSLMSKRLAKTPVYNI